ncbi:hypothetical protein R3P38DRAFT_2777202 [Favolaschia claudopus]|uniref:Uncharacterized protein n=1 Tax=Favolaschia claudopus TaxID=2862362 RepID=A0AAW0BM12_9AGAR
MHYNTRKVAKAVTCEQVGAGVEWKRVNECTMRSENSSSRREAIDFPSWCCRSPSTAPSDSDEGEEKKLNLKRKPLQRSKRARGGIAMRKSIERMAKAAMLDEGKSRNEETIPSTWWKEKGIPLRRRELGLSEPKSDVILPQPSVPSIQPQSSSLHLANGIGLCRVHGSFNKTLPCRHNQKPTRTVPTLFLHQDSKQPRFLVKYLRPEFARKRRGLEWAWMCARMGGRKKQDMDGTRGTTYVTRFCEELPALKAGRNTSGEVRSGTNANWYFAVSSKRRCGSRRSCTPLEAPQRCSKPMRQSLATSSSLSTVTRLPPIDNPARSRFTIKREWDSQNEVAQGGRRKVVLVAGDSKGYARRRNTIALKGGGSIFKGRRHAAERSALPRRPIPKSLKSTPTIHCPPFVESEIHFSLTLDGLALHLTQNRLRVNSNKPPPSIALALVFARKLILAPHCRSSVTEERAGGDGRTPGHLYPMIASDRQQQHEGGGG